MNDIEKELLEIGKDALEELQGDGLSEDEAIEALSEAIDVAIPLGKVLGPLGDAIDAVDDAAIEAIVRAVVGIVKAARPDPDKIEARSEKAANKGHPRIAARRARRARRVRARQMARKQAARRHS